MKTKSTAYESAYPQLTNTCGKGINKLEYFAAMALQGLAANPDWVKSMRVPDDWDEYKKRVANDAVELAYATILECQKPPSEFL